MGVTAHEQTGDSIPEMGMRGARYRNQGGLKPHIILIGDTRIMRAQRSVSSYFRCHFKNLYLSEKDVLTKL